jgi:hypothetical protein
MQVPVATTSSKCDLHHATTDVFLAQACAQYIGAHLLHVDVQALHMRGSKATNKMVSWFVFEITLHSV